MPRWPLERGANGAAPSTECDCVSERKKRCRKWGLENRLVGANAAIRYVNAKGLESAFARRTAFLDVIHLVFHEHRRDARLA